MAVEGPQKKSGSRKGWWLGLSIGVVLTIMMVFASGYMIETTNKDTFCATCHVMKPFRTAWQQAVHGGQNPRGFTAQCTDCHLPHGDFFQYLFTKAKSGASDIIQNFSIDGATYDWANNAETRRNEFTFETACRRCHHDLTPPGMKVGGFLAHRTFLLGETDKTCVSCHSHVGHKDMIEMVDKFYKKQKTT